MNYCLGTVQFGLKYGVQNNQKPEKELVFKLLDTAFFNGINTFDTASAYGDSELILGEYFHLNKKNADNARIISKISSDILDGADAFSSKDVLYKCISESIKKLQINKLYGMLFHDSKVVNCKERIQTLVEIKNSNLVSKVGISIYSPEEALKAIEYGIDIIQVPYNLFDNRLDKVDFFKKAKQKGIEIYARSSLLQGLALMDCNKLPDKVKFAKEFLVKFDDLCKKYNINRLTAAVSYVSSNEYIDYIVFGTDNMEQLLEYLSIRDCSLPKEFIEEIKIAFDNVPEKLVNPVLWK